MKFNLYKLFVKEGQLAFFLTIQENFIILTYMKKLIFFLFFSGTIPIFGISNEKRLQKIETSIAVLTTEIKAVNRRIDDLNNRIDDLNSRISDLTILIVGLMTGIFGFAAYQIYESKKTDKRILEIHLEVKELKKNQGKS